MTVNSQLDYVIWENEKLGTEGIKRYVCFRMFARADDQTIRAIQQSSFMYGFFDGMACWYAVLTDESREQAELMLAGGVFVPFGE